MRAVAVLSVFIALCITDGGAMAQSGRQAKLSWWDRAGEQTIGKYWIKSDLPQDVTQRVGGYLNLVHAEFTQRLVEVPVRVQEQLNVFLFAERDEFIFTLRARFGIEARTAGGLFFRVAGSGTGADGSALAVWMPQDSIAAGSRLGHILAHEGFHQFAFFRFGEDLPPWANEGLAEYFGLGVLTPTEGGLKAAGQSLLLGQRPQRAIEVLRGAIQDKKIMPLEALVRLKQREWMKALSDKNAPILYHQAWSLVHFFIHGEGGNNLQAFRTYLKALNGAMPPEHAFEKAFGSDFASLERRWSEYVMALEPSALITALERMEFLAAGLMELAKNGVQVASLEELKSGLRDAGFSIALPGQHGLAVVYDAGNDALFAIPKDELCAQPPRFEVGKSRGAALPRREQVLDEANPLPATLSTSSLGPWNASLQWVRNADNSGFGYTIVLR